MDFYNVIERRKSTRSYTSDIPEKEKIIKIIDAARLAPTWANKQGMHYIVVQDPERVKEIWHAIGQKEKFVNAPIFIVGAISENDSGSRSIKYYSVDFGICFEHLILAATAEGLATCWIGWFNEELVKEILNIPKKYHVLGITPLGYSPITVSPGKEVKNRKLLKEILHYETFT